MKARRTDPLSSHHAAKRAAPSAKVHREMIVKALKKKNGQTGRELEKSLRGRLSYTQIMRRVGEVAKRGKIRPCKTGLVRGNVVEWRV